jgi:5'-nucleotidase
MPDEARIALIDLDNTLVDYTGGIVASLNKIRNDQEELLTRENCFREPLPHWLQERMWMVRLVPGWWRNLPVNALGMQLFDMAHDIGFELHILTQGPSSDPNAWKEKVEWCRAHLKGDYKITITEDKSNVYGRVLVDDYPKYMRAWMEHRPRGLGLMPMNAFNQDFSHERVLLCSPDNLAEARNRMVQAFERAAGPIQ